MNPVTTIPQVSVGKSIASGSKDLELSSFVGSLLISTCRSTKGKKVEYAH